MVIVKAKLVNNNLIGCDKEVIVLFEDGVAENDILETLDEMAFENWFDYSDDVEEDDDDIYGDDYGFDYEVIPEIDYGFDVVDMRKSA